MAASKTQTAATTAAPNVFEKFTAPLKQATLVVTKFETGAVLARVVWGAVLGSMYDAKLATMPTLKEGAKRTERKAQTDSVEKAVLDFVEKTIGQSYSWSNVAAWVNAARVNATLPENLRVKLVGTGKDAYPVGVFSTFPLRALGRIEDEKARTKLAIQLAKSGDVSQAKVEDAVASFLGKGNDDTTIKPKAADKMAEALVKRTKKNHAGLIGKVSIYAAQINDPDALAAIATLAREMWVTTPSDPAVADLKKRAAKRVRVFNDSFGQITAIVEEFEDGIDDGDAKP